MPINLTCCTRRGLKAASLAGTLFLSLVIPAAPAPSIVSNRDVQVALRAGEHAPRLEWMRGSPGNFWRNAGEEPLPAAVQINGANVPLTWRLKPALCQAGGRRAIFVYESANPHLRLLWQWEARATFGPVEHQITVQNLSAREVWLPMLDSLRLDWRIPSDRQLRNLYVEKGADTPSPQGTHLETVSDGYAWNGESSTYAFPQPGQAREIIPAEIVYSPGSPQPGWYAGIEFSGRTRIHLQRSAASLESTLGLNPDPGPFRTRLIAGGSFETPVVFLGAFSGGPDGAGNQLRPWVRAVLGNPLTWKDPSYPLTVNNSWGSGMQVDEALALRMIADSRALGLEMFHIDAGWFRGVGDWVPRPKEVSSWTGSHCRGGPPPGLAFRHLGRLVPGCALQRARSLECARPPSTRLAGDRPCSELEARGVQGANHRPWRARRARLRRA